MEIYRSEDVDYCCMDIVVKMCCCGDIIIVVRASRWSGIL